MNMLRDMLQPTRRNMLRSMFTSTSALTRFGINGVEAALALDFIGSEYRTGNTATTFAEAFTGNSPRLTYNPGSASSSQSTMTQGYGPELVTNGDFSGGDNGDWVAQADWSITGGAASKTTGTQNSLYQDLTGVSPDSLYEITFDVSNKSGGGVLVFFTGSTVTTVSGNGLHTFIVQASATNSRISFQGQANTTVTIDNISIREAPKIVWAPHNLLDYSEDFSQWSAVAVGSGIAPVLVSSNNTAPDGTNTATRFQFDLNGQTKETHLSTIQRSVTPNTLNVDHTFRLWVKSTDGTSTYNMEIANVGAAPITVDGTWRPVEFEFTVTGQLTPGIYLRSDRTPVNSDTADILVWGAHYHRSDLGGMAPVPGAVGDFQYYVPTNGNAEYLPRVGHHVFNGSTWVNEGLLIESELRTNLIQHSDFSGGTITPAGIKSGGFVPNSASGLDGATSATVLIEDTSTGSHRLNVGGFSITSGVVYTASVYAKPNGRNEVRLTENATTGAFASFNVETGAIVSSGLGGSGLIEDAGGGWYRCAMTFTSAGTGGRIDVYIQSSGSASYTGDDTSGLYLYGLQLDQGQVVNGTPVDAPTPSSYIPTYGSTVIRGGQSLTVPPAQFGWPEPEVIGPELVTDFSTYADQAAFDVDWTRGTGWTFSGGVASCDGTQVSRSSLYAIPLTVGKVCEFSMEVSSVTAGSVRLRNGIGGSEVYIADQSSAGTYTGIATVVGGVTLVVDADANFVGSIDNISVREINPLSVSIQMDGRMTYIDDGDNATATMARWELFGQYVQLRLRTDSTRTGSAYALMYNGIATLGQDTNGAATDITPGVLVPINAAGRFGSTFLNVAMNGTSASAITTPTALPDLSNADLQIAQDFMGTIGTFRQFAGDVGDAGLEEASLTPYGTDFVMTITTTGADETFTIPCQDVGTFDASIDWGDGSFSGITAYDDAGLAHTFASAGDHTIRISGSFPNIYFNNGGDKLKVTRVDNLGNVGWATFERAFFGCSNMTSFAGGNTDTSAVTSMDVMFYNCSSLTSLDVSSFDTSAVTNMGEMFYNCSSLTSLDVSSFDTSVVTSMAVMFRYCSSLTSLDVSGFNTSAVTGMARMFADCSSLTDVIGVENFDIEGLNNVNDLKEFMIGVTLPTARYDALLVNWDAQEPFDGMSPNFGNSKYTANSAAATARANLISNDGWTITDGGTA